MVINLPMKMKQTNTFADSVFKINKLNYNDPRLYLYEPFKIKL